MATNENNLDGYNEVATTLGGAGGDLNDIVAVRAIAVLEGVSGGPVSILDDNMTLRLNAIDVGAGGPGGHLNTLDALNSIVVLKGGLGGHENDLDAINEWVDFALTYLLRATFDAADQGFADAQVLDTEAEGVTAGQLTVVEVDGTLAIVSNKCAFTAQTTPTTGDQGFFSQAITRAIGQTLLFTVQSDNTGNDTTAIGFFDTTDLQNASALLTTSLASTAGVVVVIPDGTGRRVFDWVASTDYTFAVVLGGYDINGVPLTASDDKANFLFGASLYVKGGVFTTWTLLWKNPDLDTSTGFAAFGTFNAIGDIDDFRVPDRDLSDVLLSSALSTFTASNGTSLDAITPEVGPAWTEESGNWDIQSNRANPDGAAIATVASGEADAVIDCIVNGGTSDNPAIVLRLSNTSNLWYLQADRANDLLELHEVNATVDTVRASAAVTIGDSTDFDLRAIADGQTIDGYLDTVNKISYALASLNETVENHGIRAETTLGQFDNFAVFARTAAVYDTEFDAV